MPNLGSLAKSLTKTMISVAGDGAKSISLVLLDEVTYTLDGDFTQTSQTVSIGKALMGSVSEGFVAKYQLIATTHVFLVSWLDWQASGARNPDAYDFAIIDGVKWNIEKIVEGSFQESFLIFAKPAREAI